MSSENKLKVALSKSKKLLKRSRKMSDTKDGLTRYLAYLQSPWKIMFHNFVAGVFYGFGFLLGASVLMAVLGFVVSKVLSQIPFVGDTITVFFDWVQTRVTDYQSTR